MNKVNFGVVLQKNNLFALRILCACGQFSAEEIIKIAQIAERFGNGTVTATSRGTFEIEGVAADVLDDAAAEIKKQNLRLGGTGATVRAVVACKGTTCRRGMFDVHALACRLDEKFYAREVPKKFKIGVFGCMNSLGKAMAHDVGVMPSFTKLGCYEIYLGGLLGNKPVQGKHVSIPLTEKQLIDVIEFVLQIYIERGVYPQRLRAVLDNNPELWDMIINYIQELTKQD